jgi:hypothetical protein
VDSALKFKRRRAIARLHNRYSSVESLLKLKPDRLCLQSGGESGLDVLVCHRGSNLDQLIEGEPRNADKNKWRDVADWGDAHDGTRILRKTSLKCQRTNAKQTQVSLFAKQQSEAYAERGRAHYFLNPRYP